MGEWVGVGRWVVGGVWWRPKSSLPCNVGPGKDEPEDRGAVSVLTEVRPMALCVEVDRRCHRKRDGLCKGRREGWEGVG